MQLLATAGEMQKFDRTAISKLGIPGLILMENAGRAFVDELSRHVIPLGGKHVVVVCGKGNNGGDGFVIARHLLNRGCSVIVALLCKRNNVRDDARTNLDILFKMARKEKNALRIMELVSARPLSRLDCPDIIVDAIFGTGFKGRASGNSLGAIRWINQSKTFIASVDISSGVNGSTGIVEGEAVNAHHTVAMGLAKVGQFVGAGKEHSGKVSVADISIPRTVVSEASVQVLRVMSEDIGQILPKRALTAHKYSVGKVFILAGSRRFVGAPFMCAQAAMRVGAGAVMLGTPKSVQQIIARKVTEVITVPLDETPEGTISQASYEAIQERVEWADVVAIGPGLSRQDETLTLVLQLMTEIQKPLVLDADALFVLANAPSILKRRDEPAILTPHTGELGTLLRKSSKSIEMERIEASRASAATLGSIVCLKGAPTLTSVPKGSTFLNSTGNPGMATIGSGDVLTGMIAGLRAQGMRDQESAYAGVFVHGLAGDIAASRLGERSIMALDILDCIPNALRMLERK